MVLKQINQFNITVQLCHRKRRKKKRRETESESLKQWYLLQTVF